METEKGKSINADNYVGLKTTITSARIEQMKFGAVIRLISEIIPLKDGDELRDGKDLRASKILGLGTSEISGKYIIIEDSNLDKFLKSKKIKIENDYELGDNVQELLKVPVVIQKTEDGYLEIA